MYKIQLVIPASDETGWNFPTKEEAEKFLINMNYIKVNSDSDIWSGKPTRGQSTWVPVVCINEVPE